VVDANGVEELDRVTNLEENSPGWVEIERSFGVETGCKVFEGEKVGDCE
jgi:hypothetical protein